MRIVITVPWGERLGGAENILWTFLRHTARHDLQPTVVFLQSGGFEREVAALGLETVVIRAGRLRNGRSFLRAVRKIAELLRLRQPDLVLNWAAKTQVYGALAASLVGMADRVVWWQQGVPGGHWLDRLATLLPARAVGCYSQLASQAQQQHWPHRQTHVVHPGIDGPTALAEDDLTALRSRLSIHASSLVIGIVGRLQPWKGQDRFLRAFAAVSRRHQDVHGLIVGGDAYDLSPGYEAHLHGLAHELAIEDKVTFTGQVSDAAPYVQLMDVSVNASLGEPFGIVLLEAMALGVPVVAFDAGGPAEIIESERSGILVPLQGTPSLAEALERLVSDDGLRRRIGRSGYERFSARFSAERMTRELAALFEEISIGKPKPLISMREAPEGLGNRTRRPMQR